jgi:NAD(P)-dependent dehydrogenase (short-subunit alcohol dehydrogenase family)
LQTDARPDAADSHLAWQRTGYRGIDPSMPTALVTGASRGIGLAVARDLAKDHNVILGVRDPGKAPGAGRAERLDVSDPDSIAAFVARVEGPLDVLVNNAGVYTGSPRDIWAVNVRGPLLLTRALAGKLARGARVVMVTSGLGDLSNQAESLRQKLEDPRLTIDDILGLCERPAGGYGPSKAALNALTRLFARELPNARVNAVCPGWVRTDMGGPGAPRSVEQGAASVLWACRLAADGPTGGLFRDGQPIAL